MEDQLDTSVNTLSLAEVEAVYGSLMDTVPSIVYVVESFPPYATIYISPSIELLGYTSDEWGSKPDSWSNIIHPEDREWVLHQIEEAQTQSKENDYEYRVIAKDGTTHWLYDSSKLVGNKLGNLICRQGFLLDITRRKKAEDERQAVTPQLLKALAVGNALSGILSICSYCKKVRDDQNSWESLDRYITQHSPMQFSHGICLECYDKIALPELSNYMHSKDDETL